MALLITHKKEANCVYSLLLFDVRPAWVKTWW